MVPTGICCISTTQKSLSLFHSITYCPPLPLNYFSSYMFGITASLFQTQNYRQLPLTPFSPTSSFSNTYPTISRYSPFFLLFLCLFLSILFFFWSSLFVNQKIVLSTTAYNFIQNPSLFSSYVSLLPHLHLYFVKHPYYIFKNIFYSIFYCLLVLLQFFFFFFIVNILFYAFF